MYTHRREMLLSSLKILNLALTIGSFLLAAFLTLPAQSTVGFEEFLAMRIKVSNFVLFLVWMLLWHMTFRVLGLYSSRRLSGRLRDSLDIVKASTVGVLIIGAFGVVFHIQMISAAFLFVFWALACAILMVNRMALRSLLEQIRLRGRNLRNMVIVGTGNRGIQFAHSIAATPELGYHIEGFVDQDWSGLEEFERTGFQRVANFETLAAYLRTAVVDEVVIALPIRSLHEEASQIAALCEEHGITSRVLSDLFDMRFARSRADQFDGASLITHHTVADGWPVFAKRALDIAVSSFLLVLLSPLMLLTALVIKLTSPGAPVLFGQYRVGLYKRPFKIFKFRSMVPDAEKVMKEIEHLNEVSGPVFKIKNDPRITPVGRFIRKTSIDELPQLLNVLKGDMSLVGPRPLPLRDYEGFQQDWQRRRFSVRPGITCLWQIAGRSSIPFEKWMQLDIQYIDNWSLWLDMKILAGTIPVVLKGSGAA